jgi:hypothetical protein
MVNVFLNLKLLLKGTKNEAQFLKVAVSYCSRPPVILVVAAPLPPLGAAAGAVPRPARSGL